NGPNISGGATISSELRLNGSTVIGSASSGVSTGQIEPQLVGTAIVSTGTAPNVLSIVNTSGQSLDFSKVQISIVKIS
ncbi:MAG: hypothetical protein ACRDB0_00320, partial [Paraclostridium sp.]